MIKTSILRERIPIALLLALTLCAFLEIGRVTDAMQGALFVCARAVIPSLFPFLLLTEAFMRTKGGQEAFSFLGKPLSLCFRTSSAGGAVYLVGILFGFPLAAKVLTFYRLSGAISKKEAERLLLFTNNTGPAFIIGGIGIKMLGSVRFGIVLYLIEICVSFLFGCVLGIFCKKEKEVPPPPLLCEPFSLPSIVQKSALQMLSICGYIALFSVLSSLISSFAPTKAFCALIYSLCELGSAAAFISSSLFNALTIPFLAFALCFSGASVYLQAMDFLSKTDISSKYYIPVKLLQGFFAFFFSYLLLPFLA